MPDPTAGANDSPLAALAAAVAAAGLEVDAPTLARLDAYRAALWGWNEKLNLTRHTTVEKFVERDLFDSLELSKLIGPNQRVLDVGSGGGTPAAPLAITRPDLRVEACESVAKKAAALAAIVAESAAPVRVHAARVEQLLEGNSYDTLVARAVAPLWKFLTWLKPHQDRFGRLYLIKGPAWVEERGEARHRGVLKGFDLRRAADYTTPRTSAVSTILCVTPKR